MRTRRLPRLILPVLVLAIAGWLLGRNAATWRPEWINRKAPGEAMALSPDGKWLGMFGMEHETFLLNIESGERRDFPKDGLIGDFSPDGRYIFVIYSEPSVDTVKIFETATRKLVATKVFRGTTAHFRNYSFAPGEKANSATFTVFSDGQLDRWTVPSMVARKSFTLDPKSAKTPNYTSAHFLQNGKYLFISDIAPKPEDNSEYVRLRLFDTASGKLIHETPMRLSEESEYIQPASIVPGRELFSLTWGFGELEVKDLKTAKFLWRAKSSEAVFSPDGTMMVSEEIAGKTNVHLVVRDSLTGKALRTTPALPPIFDGEILFSPDSNFVYVSDEAGSVLRMRVR